MKLFGNLILFLAVSFSSCEENNLEDASLTVPELITRNGYPVEVHQVETEDGFILEMHRIPYGLAEDAGPAADKPVVFLQHDILLSSAGWVIPRPKNALGYLLADQGYDVWMGNSRGNKYSRQHKFLSPEDKKFWDFSWHEMGFYDLPAMIDYTLEHTNQSQIFFIGHGQGSTAFYVMGAELPEYNSKIRAQFSLGPLAFMGNVKSPFLKMIARYLDEIYKILEYIGEYEFLPTPEFLQQICTEATQLFCLNTLFLLSGYNLEQINTELLPVIMGHTPAGASTKQFLHYAQLINSGKFRKYDYGGLINLMKYKQISPPNYDLTKVTTAVSIFYGNDDVLVAQQDLQKLVDQLPNVFVTVQITSKNFGHLDYLWGKDAGEVYDYIFRLMKGF